jgi:hypothetical protein
MYSSLLSLWKSDTFPLGCQDHNQHSMSLPLLFVFVFWGKDSLFSPGWPRTCYISQVDLELTILPQPPECWLILQECITIPGVSALLTHRRPKWPGGSLNFQFSRITVVSPDGSILPVRTETSTPANIRSQGQKVELFLVESRVSSEWRHLHSHPRSPGYRRNNSIC